MLDGASQEATFTNGIRPRFSRALASSSLMSRDSPHRTVPIQGPDAILRSFADYETAHVDTQIELDRQALALFRQLLEIGTEDREALDLEIASLEAPLAERVRRLLDQHHGQTGRLERRLLKLQVGVDLPTRLGAFTLLRELGRGGMGIVAEGQREAEGFTQRVAIKWIPAWQVDAARRQRFLFERDVVSRLRHPHIAQLVDGGEGEHGELWYAMELVEGQDLLQHCHEHRLDLRARLMLLLDLCSAVAHAHRNLILHRDIKPSNVLVDREGQLKLIDFGIAKGLDDAGEGLTQDAAPMTPRYAAPEQLRGERPTTASDVWQVTALAFELLTGQPARTEGRIRRASAAAREAQQSNTAVEAVHALDLSKALRGDLDAILAKGLQEAPEDRYSSIEELARDLGACLRGEAIAVRRHERWYAARRFVAKHRWAVGFALLAALSLLSLGSSSWWLMKKAQSEAVAARRSNELLSRMLLSYPGGDAQTMRLQDYVAHLVDVVASENELPAELQGSVLNSLVMLAHSIGAWEAAKSAARAMVTANTTAFGPDSIQAVRAGDVLVLVSADTATPGELEEFRAQLMRSDAFYAAAGPSFVVEHLDHLQARARIAARLSRTSETVEVFRKSVELTASSSTTSTEDHLLARAALAAALLADGKHSEASELAMETLQMARQARLDQPEVPLNLQYFGGHACEAMARADAPDAIGVCSDLLADLEKAGALETPVGTTALLGLGIAFEGRNDAVSALRTYERAQQVLQKMGITAGASHRMVVRGLGRQRFLLADYPGALEAQLPLLEALVESSETSGRWSQSFIVDVAESLVAAGRRAEARTVLLSIEQEGASLPPKWLARWERLSEELGSGP